MECNKDEAIRAKEIAERKFTERDYAGAKKFALKAQNLYPDLGGLSQMLMTFDVYVSSEKRGSNGDVDWYGVLGVTSRADEETIRKQYRKLALMLHPDKNKCPGADGAFKLISEAWSVLSDKLKRSSYSEKVHVKDYHQKVWSETKPRPSANGLHNSNTTSDTATRTHHKKKPSVPNSSPSPSGQKPDTFWTICNRCKTQYEYLRIYLNHTLLCPNCQHAFFAQEKAPPNFMQSSSYPSQQKLQGTSYRATDNCGSRFTQTASNGGKNAPQSTNTAFQFHENFKRQHEQIPADHLFKRSRFDDINRNASLYEKMYGFTGNGSKSFLQREISFVEVQKVLMDKGQADIRRKLQEWSSNQHKMQQRSKKQKNAVKDATGDYKNDDQEAPAAISIDVPDPDFHNFDLDRSESAFADDHVWAAYDEKDGMPRYYARIHKVISFSPFKMKISWLNSRTNTEFSSLSWVGSGFLKTCGEFRTGRHEMSESLNSFSHRVHWTKGPRGVVRILPRKSDIWALYRNWSPDWSENTPDEVIYKYEMVEVLDDYDEENGISVSPLVKVPGFKTVFGKNMDRDQVRRISKEEMFRFSHQVPYRLLTGEEAENAPKGCWELDPAATPLELIQANVEAKEPQAVDNTQKPDEEMKDVLGA